MSVDLSLWTASQFPGITEPCDWQIAADGMSVFQAVNCNPGLFCSDFDVAGSTLAGEISVNTTSDDDYIGFALGYELGDDTNPNASWYLVDWKQITQLASFGNCTDGDLQSLEGLAISEVTGIPDENDFWSHSDVMGCGNGGLQELARGANFGSTGWTNFETYRFQFEVTPTQIEVYVNDALELTVPASLDSDGKFCFYNFSQESALYSAFTRTTESPTMTPTMPPTTADVCPCSRFALICRLRNGCVLPIPFEG